MKIDVELLKNLMNLIKKNSEDKVRSFVAEYERDQLEKLREKNLNLLFKKCNKFGIRYLYLGYNEICGCEDIHYDGWPAIWEVAKSLD